MNGYLSVFFLFLLMCGNSCAPERKGLSLHKANGTATSGIKKKPFTIVGTSNGKMEIKWEVSGRVLNGTWIPKDDSVILFTSADGHEIYTIRYQDDPLSDRWMATINPEPENK